MTKLINIIKEAKIKGADGKACWKGYRYAGTKDGKDKCVKIGEKVIYRNEALKLEIVEQAAVDDENYEKAQLMLMEQKRLLKRKRYLETKIKNK